MVKLGLILIFAVSCLTIDALLSQRRHDKDSQELKEVSNKCTPGKFYKRGCKRCFCDDEKRPVCGGNGDCKLANQYPRNPSFIRNYTRPELQKLPYLGHQGANCTPGVTYRVQCNACLCLANKNLMCDNLLCPSYEDVNRITAKSLTGKACTAENQSHECLNCSCVNGVLKCEGRPNCIPTDGRRDFQEEQPLDLERDLRTNNRLCTPGMVYNRDCNRCYCQKDNSLRCTLMRCLKHTEVERLKKLRNHLEKEGL